MAHLKDEVFTPNAKNKYVYDQLYAEYLRLHNYFGRDAGSTVKRLKEIKNEKNRNSTLYSA